MTGNLAYVDVKSSVVEFDTRDMLLQLESIGYGEFLAAFNPLKIATHDWSAAKENCSPKLSLAIDFFLLGVPVEQDAIFDIVPAARVLMKNGLAEFSFGSVVSIPALALVTVGGLWLWVQRPCSNPTIYIGYDTIGLMARIRCAAGDRALDLCSGPGTQGLYMASKNCDVVAVEKNSITAQVTSINIALNALEDRMKVVVGDLYGPLPQSEKKFDLITANPPLLPFPEKHFYPFVGNGGTDGLEITWRILDGLPRWLNDTGRAHIIGTGISDGLLPVSMEKFKSAAQKNRLDILITIVGHTEFTRGTYTFEAFVATALNAGSKSSYDDICDDLESLVSAVGGSHLYYFSMLAVHGTGKVELMDLSCDGWENLWFRK